MSSWKKWVVVIVSIILTACFYILSVHAMQSFEDHMRQLSFVKLREGESFDAAKNIDISEVLWREDNYMQVENREIGRNAETIVVALHGRSDILFDATAVLDDTSIESCLLSEALAYELFGTDEVEGLSVTYKERNYRIVGTIEERNNIFVYEPSEKETILYQRLTVQNAEGKAIDVMEGELQVKFSEGRVLDYTLIQLCMELFLMVIPSGLFFFSLKLVNKYRKESRRVEERVMWRGIMIVAILFFVIAVMKSIQSPLDMIPDKWSNFVFWTDCLERKKASWDFLIRVPKTYVDIKMLEILKDIVVYNGVAIMGTIVTRKYLTSIQKSIGN